MGGGTADVVPPWHGDAMDASFTGSVFLGMSVDGFIARLDGDLSWLTGESPGGDPQGGGEAPQPDDGEGGDFGFADFVSGVDAVLMGARRTRSSRPSPTGPTRASRCTC